MCDMCPKTISLKPHHYEEHNRTIILMAMKTTTNSNIVFIVYLTELSLYLIGHQQPRIPVTHLPNASMTGL